MVDQDLFGLEAGPALELKSDAAREAIASLRGYAYQVLVTVLAWLDLPDNGRLYLEVSKDYATLVEQALTAVEVKDTKKSGTVTLNSKSVRYAISSFVDIVVNNPNASTSFHFMTTSELGREKRVLDRPGGLPGLEYWRRVAAGRATVNPLRKILESNKFPYAVRKFSKARNDNELRRDLIECIHWDCGKPEFFALREELERRFVVLLRNRFDLPAPEASRLVDLAGFFVLTKSINEDRQKRFLTLADLFRLIDESTQIPVRRADINAFLALGAKLNEVVATEPSGRQVVSSNTSHWLVDGATLPKMEGSIARTNLESDVAAALDKFGTAVVTGSSGLGKSMISRAVAVATQLPYYLVHFRNLEEKQVCALLDLIFVRIGELPQCTMILEDLNNVERPRVALLLARVTEALRRRYRPMILTCHREPSVSVLTSTNLDVRCVVKCGYFSEDEARSLVTIHGGNPEVWGRLAHVAGAFGHPQLTHAFVKGIAARRWPTSEIRAILHHGFSSEDIDAVKEDARRILLAALPDDTRILLYRLSLAIGTFNRSTAFVLGSIFPSIAQAGESLDQLIGPWIEGVGNDLFRVSPLASGAGVQMLSAVEQQIIHRTIATERLGRGKIIVNEIDPVLLHGISGRSAKVLNTIAGVVVTANPDTLEKLAEHVMLFRFLKTDIPIFPSDHFLSCLLRLAQFNLSANGTDRGNINHVADALFTEVSALPDGEGKQVFEYFALISVLRTLGIANQMSEWLALLVKLKRIMVDGDLPPEVDAVVEGKNGDATVQLLSSLFTIGSGELESVKGLECIVNQLDQLDSDCRDVFLTPMDESLSDYSLFINGPWNNERSDDTFDAKDASQRYGRMAERTRSWGIPSLSQQCTVAQAVILNEYQNDSDEALRVIREAMSDLGDDLILRQGLAKVHFHNREYSEALVAFRAVADRIGIHSPVDRAFSLREGAICAAKCGDWALAEEWFLDAKTAAAAVGTPDMDVMAIGLGADSAVAALETARISQGLRRLAEAVGTLRHVDPERNLRAAHCHRVVRHAVLWARARIQSIDVRIQGLPIRADAGICSNPDPLPDIRELPLGHIDIAWYMLAGSERAAGLDEGIAFGLDDQLEGGPIPSLEFDLRRQEMVRAIERVDAASFTDKYSSYMDAASFVFENGEQFYKKFNPLAPERHAIPMLAYSGEFTGEIQKMAKGPLLSFALLAVMKGRVESIELLKDALDERFSGFYPGRLVFEQLQGGGGLEGELDRTVASLIEAYSVDSRMSPDQFWIAGLRFFEWASQSLFKDLLVPHLAAWQRSGWRRVTQKERFRLFAPTLTVPRIEEILNYRQNNEQFLAGLILATSEAVGSTLGREYREKLDGMAKDMD